MKRTLIYGSNTIISIALFAVVLVLINVLPKELKAVNLFGTRVPLQKQWDLTENRKFTLTDQTQKVLARLDTPVTAIGFAIKGSAQYTALEDMLKQYAFQSPSFKYQIEDPERNPTIAQQYGIKSMRTLIMESKGADGKPHKETVTLPPAQGAADYQQMESKITAGLMRIINPKTATVYFTKGHGEAEIDDQSPQIGLGSLKSALEGENYVVKSIVLFNDKVVPADASVVVIAGVNKDFLPEEVNALQKYLASGGRVLAFYNALPVKLQSLPNLDRFFATQGIVPQNDLVISSLIAPLNSRERLLAPAVQKYGASPITEKFTLPTVYPVTRSFKIDKPPKDAQVMPLATTVAETWQIRHPLTQEMRLLLASTEDPRKIYEEGKDTKGEAILAVTGKYTAVPTDLELAPEEKPAPSIGGSTLPGQASGTPAVHPSGEASAAPSGAPSAAPSGAPSAAPSGAPSAAPSGAPSAAPSGAPSMAPSGAPSAVPGASPEKPKTEARVVVFGSLQMVAGGFFGLLGNGDLVMNSIAWLTERTEQIAISRPDVKKQPLTLDEQSLRKIDWFAMPFLPCLVGLIGLFVHWAGKRH